MQNRRLHGKRLRRLGLSAKLGYPSTPAKGAVAPLDSRRHSTELYADFGY